MCLSFKALSISLIFLIVEFNEGARVNRNSFIEEYKDTPRSTIPASRVVQTSLTSESTILDPSNRRLSSIERQEEKEDDDIWERLLRDASIFPPNRAPSRPDPPTSPTRPPTMRPPSSSPRPPTLRPTVPPGDLTSLTSEATILDPSNRRLSSIERQEEKDDIWERLLRDASSFQPTKAPSRPDPPTSPTRPPTMRPPSTSPRPPTQRPTVPPGDLPCNIPLQLRAQLLTDMAKQVSGQIDRGTPQFEALSWLINQDRYYVCPDDPKAYQRYILAVFYFSSNGDAWDECSAPDNFDDPDSIARANARCTVKTTPIPGGSLNQYFLPTTEGSDAWLTPVYECEWAGITCRVEGNCVDRVEFEMNGVGGTLPFELRDLGDLRFLILERGTISGTIPSEFGEIEDLLFLDLDFNNLSGTIPDSIYDLDQMFQLDLNNNRLTGTLSSLIGNLDQLTFFQTAANQFSGTIPSELGNLSNLLAGSFEDNVNLSGTIPEELCDLINSKPTYTLIADCNPDGSNPPRVECSCCTDCYPRIGRDRRGSQV